MKRIPQSDTNVSPGGPGRTSGATVAKQGAVTWCDRIAWKQRIFSAIHDGQIARCSGMDPRLGDICARSATLRFTNVGIVLLVISPIIVTTDCLRPISIAIEPLIRRYIYSSTALGSDSFLSRAHLVVLCHAIVAPPILSVGWTMRYV